MEENQLTEKKPVSIWNKMMTMDKAMHEMVIRFFIRYKRIFFTLGIILLVTGLLFLFMLSLIYFVPAAENFSYKNMLTENLTNYNTDSLLIKKQAKILIKDIESLQKKLDRKKPRSAYLIVNTSKNKFLLYNNSNLIGKGRCSTGSYILLSNGEEQQWIFKTPKGVFTIKGKTTQPVWIKPDWAFVEEGLPIPPVAHSSRYEYGVLGDYALSLGHGYLIHGTLYQRFLGLPVTHGCIRLNDDDLKLVYQRLNVGSKVFIY